MKPIFSFLEGSWKWGNFLCVTLTELPSTQPNLTWPKVINKQTREYPPPPYLFQNKGTFTVLNLELLGKLLKGVFN